LALRQSFDSSSQQFSCQRQYSFFSPAAMMIPFPVIRLR
jgi:hypothetical protein